MCYFTRMPLRSCSVSFKDVNGIKHAADVQAESLYEAAVLAVRRFREDPWLERVGPTTLLQVEVREQGATHSLTLQQVERWLASPSPAPSESVKKNKLKMILVKG